MNVLVTGGGGFMGMALIKRLIKEGHKVTSFSRREYPLHWALGIASIQADITDYDAVEKACENRGHPATTGMQNLSAPSPRLPGHLMPVLFRVTEE